MTHRGFVRRPVLLAAFLIGCLVVTSGAEPAYALPPTLWQASPQGADSIDPAAATLAHLATVPAEQRARADAYTEGNHWIWLWNTLILAIVVFLVLQLGWSRRIRDAVERRTRSNALQVFAYFAVFLTLIGIVTLPWRVYVDLVRERHYGLSTQTPVAWLTYYVTSFGVELVVAGIAAIVFYAIVRRLPRSWPYWGALAGAVFTAFQILVYPVFVAPLFNTFTPLTDERVREPLLAMARANGMDPNDIYVMDESSRSPRINAQVTGLLGTERIVLNDNLLTRTSPPEIKHAMGHELGHYVLNHYYESLVRSVILVTALLLALQHGFGWATRKWGTRWGIRGIGDVAGLPLLFLLFTLVTAAGAPLTRTLSRADEREADIFALNVAREPDAAVRLALRLVETRKLDPHPIEEALFYGHPSPRSRIYQAMVWKAETPGADADR